MTSGAPFPSLLARLPVVPGFIVMIVGYHVWEPPGFVVAVVLFIVASVSLARLRQESEEKEELRLRAGRAHIQEPPPSARERGKS